MGKYKHLYWPHNQRTCQSVLDQCVKRPGSTNKTESTEIQELVNCQSTMSIKSLTKLAVIYKRNQLLQK